MVKTKISLVITVRQILITKIIVEQDKSLSYIWEIRQAHGKGGEKPAEQGVLSPSTSFEGHSFKV